MKRIAPIALTLILLSVGGQLSARQVSQTVGHPWEREIRAFWDARYGQFEAGLKGSNRPAPGTNKYVLDEQSLYLSTDISPLGVQLRRTRALVTAIKKLPAVRTWARSRRRWRILPRGLAIPRTPRRYSWSFAMSPARQRWPTRC